MIKDYAPLLLAFSILFLVHGYIRLQKRVTALEDNVDDLLEIIYHHLRE